MHIRKSQPEQDETPYLPIPTQVVSNGEYLPQPQSAIQRRIEALVQELAAPRAKKLGMKRRDFLRTAAGTATVMLAMNQVAAAAERRYPPARGRRALRKPGEARPNPVPFRVCNEDTTDPARARHLFSAPYFIVDVQTHHVDTGGLWYAAFRNAIAGLRFRDFGACSPSDTSCKIGLITRQNYVKELFLDSETAIAVMSGVPPGAAGILPNTTMAETRDEVNEAADSQRCLAQMLIEPRAGVGAGARTSIEDIERNAQELGAVAIKCYPGSDQWWLDDERLAYPMYERALRAGIRNICVHKGFPQLFGAQSAQYVQSIDIAKAARDWPQLNFIIYHSGYFPEPQRLADGTIIPAGIEQFARVLEENQDLTNIYAEIGSTFAIGVAGGGVEAMETIARLLQVAGPDRIIWGTDSVWWGTPQWQIAAFKALQISEDLQEQGYPALTEQARAKIFGLNAARLYGIDVRATRCTLAGDRFEQRRGELDLEAPAAVAQPHGPRTRREFLGLAALEQKFDQLRHQR